MIFKRYDSRFQAGEILADLIHEENEPLYDLILENPLEFFCFAIPNGGVPVVESFSVKLKIYYDIVIVRKIKIPWNTEAGFGAITTDGSVLINKPLLDHLELSDKDVNGAINLTKTEIDERLQFYNKKVNFEKYYEKNIQGKHILMLDDGLASGFTMLAAIKMVKKYNPKKIYLAVPTAPLHTVQRIQKTFNINKVFCPNIKDVMRFAVADAYLHWYDVSENEVAKILKMSKFYIK